MSKMRVLLMVSALLWSLPLGAEEPVRKGCPRGMALVPGGSFRMAAAGGAVTVESFCMDVTEVTVDAWSACVKAGKCSTRVATFSFPDIPAMEARELSANCNYGKRGKGRHPINCVGWADADAFCRVSGKRLPAEAEWEWAARGGENGWRFPWGNESPLEQLCWSGSGGRLGKERGTCPVGSKPEGANPQGIQDLAGGVWEYVAGTSGRATYVDRGGGWRSYTVDSVSVIFRAGVPASARPDDVGFRCASDPVEEKEPETKTKSERFAYAGRAAAGHVRR